MGLKSEIKETTSRVVGKLKSYYRTAKIKNNNRKSENWLKKRGYSKSKEGKWEKKGEMKMKATRKSIPKTYKKKTSMKYKTKKQGVKSNMKNNASSMKTRKPMHAPERFIRHKKTTFV